MPSTRATLVCCRSCGFQTTRVPRSGGGFGACPDCQTPLCQKQPRAQYIKSGQQQQSLAEARATLRVMYTLHPERARERGAKTAATLVRRYGPEWFRHMQSYRKRDDG
jgi:hypothetical protein